MVELTPAALARGKTAKSAGPAGANPKAWFRRLPRSADQSALLLIHDFRVNDGAFVFLFSLGAAGFGAGLRGRLRAFAGAGLLGRRFIQLGAHGLPGLVQFLTGGLDRRGVRA